MHIYFTKHHSFAQPTLHMLRAPYPKHTGSRAACSLSGLPRDGKPALELWLTAAVQQQERVSITPHITAQEKIKTQNSNYSFYRMRTAFAPL